MRIVISDRWRNPFLFVSSLTLNPTSHLPPTFANTHGMYDVMVAAAWGMDMVEGGCWRAQATSTRG